METIDYEKVLFVAECKADTLSYQELKDLAALHLSSVYQDNKDTLQEDIQELGIILS